jgi:hypothetical protein
MIRTAVYEISGLKNWKVVLRFKSETGTSDEKCNFHYKSRLILDARTK